MVSLVAMLVLSAASTGPSVIIWGGGKEAQAANDAKADFVAQASLLEANGVKLAEGFPKILMSSEHPGLKPGFHILAVGACDAKAADEVLARLRAISPGVYVRALSTPSVGLGCPVLAPAPAKVELACGGFGLGFSAGDDSFLYLGDGGAGDAVGDEQISALGDGLSGDARLQRLGGKRSGQLQVGRTLIALGPAEATVCHVAEFADATLGIPHFGAADSGESEDTVCGNPALVAKLDCSLEQPVVLVNPGETSVAWLKPSSGDEAKADACVARLAKSFPPSAKAKDATIEGRWLAAEGRRFLEILAQTHKTLEVCGNENDYEGTYIGLAEVTAKGCELVSPLLPYGFPDDQQKVEGWLLVNGAPKALTQGRTGVRVEGTGCRIAVTDCDCGC